MTSSGESLQGGEEVSEDVYSKEPLNYGSFHETSEHFSKEENKDVEDHYEPQNEVLAANEGGQFAQNEEAEGQNIGAQNVGRIAWSLCFL